MVSNEIVTEEEVTELTEDTVEIGAKEPGSETLDEDNGEIDSTSIEFEEIIKDYLDPGLMNGIRIIESSELSNEDIEEVPVSDEEMGKYIETFSDIAQNQIITGRVIGQNEKEIIMDIGFKSEGIIPRSEFSSADPPNLGDSIEVYLEKIEDKNGQTILSKEKAVWMKGWLKLMQIHKEEGTVNGTITRRIKGGLVVDVDGIQAFLPGSQIDVRPVQDFDKFLGKEMEFKIVKINQLRKNVVLSRKALLYNTMKEQRESLFEGIEVGQIVEGVVKNITDFGVFVDLGGVDGLLHITDLSWGRVNHPSEVTEVGETINVKIIDIDKDKLRISLGLKQLTPHPWENVEEKFPVGTKISGKVVSLTNYGAFVELETGVEGLVHISEMSWTRGVHRPDEVVQLGQEVEAQILSIDTEERKIALGFKQLLPDPWENVDEQYAVGSTLKGTVRNLTQFGAFVELEKGVDGLIHVSDLSWTKVIRHPKEILRKGEQVEAKILEVSQENHRIALGLKQASEDPWDDIITHFKVGKIVGGTVIRTLDKGIIVELEMDVEGIVPADSMSEDERNPSLKEGQKIQCEVVEVKPEDKKVMLTFVDVPTPAEVPTEEKGSETKEEKPKVEAASEDQESKNEPNDAETSESTEEIEPEETE